MLYSWVDARRIRSVVGMTTSWGRIACFTRSVCWPPASWHRAPLVPALQRDLGLSLAGAGMTVSIVTLVGALFGLPAGGWSKGRSRPRAPHRHSRLAAAAALCAMAGGANSRSPRALAARLSAGRRRLPSLMVSTATAAPCFRAVAVGHLRTGRHRAFARSGASPTAQVGGSFSPSTPSCWPSA
jgi:hypothetical protein